MNARNRQLLVLAMTTALVTPVALAQNVKGTGKAIGQAATQEATPRLPPPALPPRVTDSTEALLNTNAPPSLQQLNESVPPLPPEVEEAAMNPPKPPPVNAQGAAKAAGHSSSIRQRDKWAQLDVNGDGRISGTEGQVDADFKANFEMMDANDDGFVTDVEFRAQAKAEHDEREERDKDQRDD